MPRATRALETLAAGAAVATLLVFAWRATTLVAYPWDWTPDEGLTLDWGRRAAQDPAGLYERSWVPFPAAYGPLLPALLAPLSGLGLAMLPAARVLALGWTLVAALAVHLLVRARADPLTGLVAAALSLAALDVSFWLVLVRPDGPMVALWLLAAVALLPARLTRGSDRLGWGRVAAGSTFLLAGALTKATAVVHGAPLVLGWWLVDRRSAVHLVLTLVLAGAAAFLLLQWATDGGFLWVNRVWSFHGTQPGLREAIVVYALERMWPFGALAGVVLAAAARRSSEAVTDGAVLLAVGAALVVPLLSKYGASWNYLLPFVPAACVLAGRWWALVPLAPGSAARAAGVALGAAASVALVATREFPLPRAVDERTGRAFYSFVAEHTRRTGGPILATRPEMAYFVVDQAVEMEGSGFDLLARGGAPGTAVVLRRLQEGEYTLLVQLHDFPRSGGYAEAVAARYVHAGGCNLGYYFGTVPVHLFTRRDLPLFMSPPPGTRCGGPTLAPGPAPSSR
jgi:hypothetical protein